MKEIVLAYDYISVNHELYDLEIALTKEYGKEEALRGLHFSLNDIKLNILNIPVIVLEDVGDGLFRINKEALFNERDN